MIKRGLGIFAIAGILLLGNNASGQTIIPSNEIKQADVNFRELAEYAKAHPSPIIMKTPFSEDEEEGHRKLHKSPASQVHMYHPPLPNGAMGPAYGPMLPVSAAPNDSFLSTVSPETSIPPDTHGAVDSQYCVTAINTNIHIQTRSGAEVFDNNLDGFWSAILPAGTDAFDPRVHYDPYYKRWILVTDAVAGTAMDHSTILVAVSATNDPTGVWHMYAIPVDTTGAAWMDFPNVGFSRQWVVITGNMFANFTGGATGAVVYVLNYATLMAGTAITPTIISRSASFALCPAITYDLPEPNIFLVESSNGGAGQLKLWKITGPVSAPVYALVGTPATTQHWHGSGPGGGSDFATQVGSTNKVDAGDDRFTSMVLKNGKLWCTHTVFLPDPGTTTRSSVMWWELDTLANPLQIGMINDAATPTFFDYSSIAVNDSSDVLIGCSYLNATLHPSAAYAIHMHTDPLDSTRPAHIFRHGQAAYYTTFGGSKNRWGDYSGACIDPRNNMDFWTIQEASNAAGTSANWECWWANVQICPKPLAPTLTYVGSPCPGDTTSFIINPVAGATSYVWYVAGTGWTGASTTTTLNATAGSVPGTIVVLAYNSCGEGESNTITVTPNALPAAPLVTVINPPCTGSATALFSATGSAGFNWTVVGTGWSGSSATSSLTATVGTGTALIICAASNACGTGPADTLSIVPGTPVVTFTESTHSTYVGINVTVNFTGIAPTGSTFTWNFGGGVGTPGTGSGPQSVHWTTQGTKVVTLTVDNNGCTSTYTDTVHIKPGVGVNELSLAENTINIAPNPSDGLFDIVFASPVSNAVTVKMYDMDGRSVYTNDFSSVINNKLQIKALQLAPGTYTVSIIAGGDVVAKKVTINAR